MYTFQTGLRSIFTIVPFSSRKQRSFERNKNIERKSKNWKSKMPEAIEVHMCGWCQCHKGFFTLSPDLFKFYDRLPLVRMGHKTMGYPMAHDPPILSKMSLPCVFSLLIFRPMLGIVLETNIVFYGPARFGLISSSNTDRCFSLWNYVFLCISPHLFWHIPRTKP